jgi:predicted ester cyclase
MDATTAHKAVVRRHFAAMTDQRPETWDEIMADDFVLHGSGLPPGRSGYVNALRVAWAAFPDYRVEIEDLVAEGDRVAVRYLDRGTHLGEFLGLAPTGRSYRKPGLALYRLAGGRLVEAWFQEDDADFRRQVLGSV